MCISPIRIKNPNYGAKKVGLNLLKDCTSAFINVPCRVCPQCIAARQMELIQRVLMESQFSHLFFGTFTYNNESLPTWNINGYNIHYARRDDFQNMLKRVRNISIYPFRYFAVSEFGSKYGRPHYHLILSVPQMDEPLNIERYFYNLFLNQWRKNYGSDRKPIYRNLCTLSRKFVDGRLSTNYDFHFVNPLYSDAGVADVGFYVLKYLLKADKHEQNLQRALRMNLHPTLYNVVWDVVKSKTLFSKGFGLMEHDLSRCRESFDRERISDVVRNHIRKGIEFGKGKFDYPVFIHPLTGATFPLSDYYKNYFLTDKDAFAYYFENVGNSPYLDSIHDSEIKAQNQIDTIIDQYRRRCDVVTSKTFL